MQSSYKRLGNYIEQSHQKNDDNIIKLLQGISNKKYFQKAKTNTIGIDLSKYRIVRTGEFAFNRATTRNGDKISIALRKNEDCIVSPSYRIFKSKDENILNSQYLMMWYNRPEFDRYARFKSHGSAHEFFDWDEMCDVELPVPSIDKQKEIVKEYHTITDRIKLNESLNQKLEETAQAIYKEWFVNFEFPNVEGKPYKSSGGEMVFCDELDGKIPVGWNGSRYEHVMNFTTGKLNSNAAVINGKFPFFTCSAETFKTNTFAFDTEAVLLAGNNASAIYPLKFFIGKFDAYQRTYVITTNDQRLSNQQIYFTIKDELENFKGISSGTATKFLTMQILNNLKICLANKEVSIKFHRIIKELFNLIDLNTKELEQLNEFKDILLSKMATIEDE